MSLLWRLAGLPSSAVAATLAGGAAATLAATAVACSPRDAAEVHDVVVVGGGIMGASITHSLARRGGPELTVAMVDATHAVRGSWGESRAVHLAQADGLMLRMCRRSIGLWQQLEVTTGKEILINAGRLNMGPTGSFDKLCDTYRAHGICHKRMGPAAAAAALPQLTLQDGEEAVWIAEGWVARAAVALDATLEAAAGCGAVLLTDEAVVGIDLASKTLTTETGRKVRWRSGVVLAAGGWSNHLLGLADLPLLPLFVSAEQTVQFGIRPPDTLRLLDAAITPGGAGMPLVTYKMLGPGGKATGDMFYLVPHVPGGCEGVKVGYHQQGPVMDTEDFVLQRPKVEGPVPVPWGGFLQAVPRLVEHFDSGLDPHALAGCKAFIQRAVRGLDSSRVELFMRCLYNNVPDGDFIIGRFKHGQAAGGGGVFIATGFSGEGFKHGPAIGEFVASMVLGDNEGQGGGQGGGQEGGGQGAAADGRLVSALECPGGTVVPPGTPPLFTEMKARFDPGRFS